MRRFPLLLLCLLATVMVATAWYAGVLAASQPVHLPLVMGGGVAPTPVAGRIQPGDLVYRGAFRLPTTQHTLDNVGWEWGGTALAYCPCGDPAGPADGYPGSLFGAGHDQTQYISEIGIPAPVVSAGKDLADLPVATTLQPFSNIRGSLYDASFDEYAILRAGLAILPPSGGGLPQLLFAWSSHAPGNDTDTGPSHGARVHDLDAGASSGIWGVDAGGAVPKYLTGDYLFEIPADWAAANTQGRRLATGRFRDGGQAAEGPALFAIDPWESGSLPTNGATLPATTLLRYQNVLDQDPANLDDYHHSDEWEGGAWLTSGADAAVVFAGTKGQGACWYGCQDGTVWPDEPPFPPECPERGWWSSSFQAQMLFYDPADLALVASGAAESWSPQPYATLDLTPWLYNVTDTQQKHQVGAMAYDAERRLLYVSEPLVEEDRPIVHVWQVN